MGQLEGAVMDALWDRSGWHTPGEVHDLLPGRDQLAYSTVLTVLIRLWKKGRLERQKVGKAHAYRPIESREEHVASRIGELLDTVDRTSVLTRFVDSLDEAGRAQIRRALGTSARHTGQR